ncbi:MAG: HAMP domain-containing histidine kinase [Deltaproteobacteria bacterium]|nr:HAMP domain-containing histidine kinase [Deltaproteobacteria bacterium]
MAADRGDASFGQGAILLAVALAVVAVVVMLFLPSHLSGRARASTEREAVALVTVAAGVAAPSVHLALDDGVQRVVDGLAAIPEVKYAVVRQGDRVLAGHHATAAVALRGGFGAVYGRDLLHVGAVVPAVAPQATVQVGYSLAGLKRERSLNLALSTALAAMLLLAAVVAGMRSRTPLGLTLPEEPPEESTTSQIFAGDEFVAYISHELRTPLNAIIGYAEMLQEDAVHLEQHDLVPDLDKIQRAGAHMLALVDDVVSLQRVFAGTLTLELEDFEVEQLLDDVTSDVASLINRTLTTLTVERAPDVRRMTADRYKLQRAITNVIREATGITGQGELKLSVHKQTDAAGRVTVVYRISHPDLEISETEITQMIHGFMGQPSRALPKYHKTGLGLLISREFCRAQGGDLVVTSEAAKGTTFELMIPMTVGGSPESS